MISDLIDAHSPGREGFDRELIMQRFGEWLDATMTDESDSPSSGPVAELLEELEGRVETTAETDLYSLFSALTTLTQEVKLSGRTFQKLHDSLSPLADVPRVQHQILAELRAANQDARCAAEEQAWTEVLEELCDLRDRLARGLEAVEAVQAQGKEQTRRSLLDRIFRRRRQPEAAVLAASLLEGYRMTLGRLDDGLRRRGVRPMDCIGRDFDPHRMRAVEIATRTDGRTGEVLEVYRAGYERHGEVLRAAEVKVARLLPEPLTEGTSPQ